jgi:hypothetical protein
MIIVIIHDQHDTSDISTRMIIVRIEDGALLFLLTGEPRKECSAAIRSYVDIDCDVPHIPIYTQTYTSYSHKNKYTGNLFSRGTSQIVAKGLEE